MASPSPNSEWRQLVDSSKRPTAYHLHYKLSAQTECDLLNEIALRRRWVDQISGIRRTEESPRRTLGLTNLWCLDWSGDQPDTLGLIHPKEFF